MSRRSLSPRRGWTVLATFAMLLGLLSATNTSAQAHDDGMGAAVTAPRSEPFTGIDGKQHDPAPVTTPGRRGTLYFGQEFDRACGDGATFDQGLEGLARLARVIERSGRKVFFTVAPNKSAVNKPDLEGIHLPHGACDRQGLRAQDKSLDTFRSRNYIPLRKTLADLAADGTRQLYWHVDTHWTTVGNTRFAEALGDRLDPEIEAHQSYRGGERTITPDIATLLGEPDLKESAPARLTTTKVKVRTAPGSAGYDPIIPIAVDHRWNTKPAKRAYPGRTLIIGDSFSYVSLESLRPLFRHGRFLWIGQASFDTILDAIPHYDTVVIEVVQRFLSTSVMTQRKTRAIVRQNLAASAAGS